jgi:uncharacterized protein
MRKAHLSADPYAAWNRGDVKAAFQIFQAQARAGVKSSWLNLGYFFDVGLGTKRNRTKAISWYRRAYRAGDGAAASNIATIYRDAGRARLGLQWYRRAAALHDGDAAVEVAKHYLSGIGVRRHGGRAVVYLRRALATKHISSASRAEARRLLRSLGTAGRSNNRWRGP